MDQKWSALAREAGLAAEHIALGVTSLGKANYAHKAYYYQAFFALSTGFERSAKLILLVDYALKYEGSFPEQRIIRNYGHNLINLFEALDNVAEELGIAQNEECLPRTSIHVGIIEVLTNFATNLTRYYNLDFILGISDDHNLIEPLCDWHDKVTEPVIQAHSTQRTHQRIQDNARAVSYLLNPYARILHVKEDGGLIIDAYHASYHTGVTEFAKKYTRMYVMQIARFISVLISCLTHECYEHRLDYIPHLAEYFAIFNNHDKYFKKRKTWTIY